MNVFTAVKPSIWQARWLGCDFCSARPLEVRGSAAADVSLDWWAIRCYWISWKAIDELAGVPVSRSGFLAANAWVDGERMWTSGRKMFFLPPLCDCTILNTCFSPYRKLSLCAYGPFGPRQEVPHALGLNNRADISKPADRAVLCLPVRFRLRKVRFSVITSFIEV